MRTVDLMDYAPEIIKEIKEYKIIAATENQDINLAWNNIENVFNEQFIQTATENGIKRWESILKISPAGNLKDRAFKVQTRLSETLPYTYKVLRNLLGQLCGPDGYELIATFKEYKLNIRVKLASKSMILAVDDMVDRIIPANLDVLISLLSKSQGILYLGGYMSTGEKSILYPWSPRELVFQAANHFALGKQEIETTTTYPKEG